MRTLIGVVLLLLAGCATSPPRGGPISSDLTDGLASAFGNAHYLAARDAEEDFINRTDQEFASFLTELDRELASYFSVGGVGWRYVQCSIRFGFCDVWEERDFVQSLERVDDTALRAAWKRELVPALEFYSRTRVADFAREARQRGVPADNLDVFVDAIRQQSASLDNSAIASTVWTGQAIELKDLLLEELSDLERERELRNRIEDVRERRLARAKRSTAASTRQLTNRADARARRVERNLDRAGKKTLSNRAGRLLRRLPVVTIVVEGNNVLENEGNKEDFSRQLHAVYYEERNRYFRNALIDFRRSGPFEAFDLAVLADADVRRSLALDLSRLRRSYGSDGRPLGVEYVDCLADKLMERSDPESLRETLIVLQSIETGATITTLMARLGDQDASRAERVLRGANLSCRFSPAIDALGRAIRRED